MAGKNIFWENNFNYYNSNLIENGVIIKKKYKY